MFAILRNVVLIFLVLSIAYAILSFTARWRHKSQLETEYKTQSELRQQTQDKEVFIAQGMKRYGRSYKPKLILGVYVIPAAVMGLLIYLAQYT